MFYKDQLLCFIENYRILVKKKEKNTNEMIIWIELDYLEICQFGFYIQFDERE